jgi:hypothetical protein
MDMECVGRTECSNKHKYACKKFTGRVLVGLHYDFIIVSRSEKFKLGLFALNVSSSFGNIGVIESSM